MDQIREYLFQSHSEATLRNWAKRLSLFRFRRASGGYVGDGDSLDVAFRYEHFEQLENFISSIGLELFRYSLKPPQPKTGVGYSWEESRKFPLLIPGTRWIRQPGHCIINGQNVFVWCERHEVSLSIHDGFKVTEESVISAEAVEKVLTSTHLERKDPPINSNYYVCPKYYPDFFG